MDLISALPALLSLEVWTAGRHDNQITDDHLARLRSPSLQRFVLGALSYSYSDSPITDYALHAMATQLPSLTHLELSGACREQVLNLSLLSFLGFHCN